MVPLSHLEIPLALRDAIFGMCAAGRPLEVGGVLLGTDCSGYRVVTDLIGPGPMSRATPTSFEPDYAFQQEEVDRLYEANAGDLTYIGDWHSHPGGRCRPSSIDRDAMVTIRTSPDARCPDPIMMIIGGRRNETMKAFVLDIRGQICELPVQVTV